MNYRLERQIPTSLLGLIPPVPDFALASVNDSKFPISLDFQRYLT